MLEGTLYAELEADVLMPTDENLRRTALENYAEEKHWGRIMEVRDPKNRNIETPGVVVLEIDENLYDPQSRETFPGLIYWVVTDTEVYEVPDSVAVNLRLGAARGIIEADSFMIGPDGGESVIFNETLAPLEKLATFGALKDPGRTLERAELHNIELNVIGESI